MFKMAERSDGCSGETLLAPCTRKKRLQRKMTKDYCWIGVQENIDMLSKSYSDRNSLILLSLFERPASLCSLRRNDRKLFYELASTC